MLENRSRMPCFLQRLHIMLHTLCTHSCRSPLQVIQFIEGPLLPRLFISTSPLLRVKSFEVVVETEHSSTLITLEATNSTGSLGGSWVSHRPVRRGKVMLRIEWLNPVGFGEHLAPSSVIGSKRIDLVDHLVFGQPRSGTYGRERERWRRLTSTRVIEEIGVLAAIIGREARVELRVSTVLAKETAKTAVFSSWSISIPPQHAGVNSGVRAVLTTCSHATTVA